MTSGNPIFLAIAVVLVKMWGYSFCNCKKKQRFPISQDHKQTRIWLKIMCSKSYRF